jgi:hypothetical protein
MNFLLSVYLINSCLLEHKSPLFSRSKTVFALIHSISLWYGLWEILSTVFFGFLPSKRDNIALNKVKSININSPESFYPVKRQNSRIKTQRGIAAAKILNSKSPSGMAKPRNPKQYRILKFLMFKILTKTCFLNQATTLWFKKTRIKNKKFTDSGTK